jgi:hypothetical protein
MKELRIGTFPNRQLRPRFAEGLIVIQLLPLSPSI